MEIKEIKIDIPEGYEIDKDNSTFERIVFKPIKKKLPKTWEEFCSTHPVYHDEEFFIDSCSNIVCNHVFNYSGASKIRNSFLDKNLFSSAETAEAFLALMQLIQLRDCYNDDWIPDWAEDDTKYSIYVHRNKIIIGSANAFSKVLTFKTEELRDKFFDNFQDLLEIAKPLL